MGYLPRSWLQSNQILLSVTLVSIVAESNFPFLRSLNDSLVVVVGPTAGELIHPSDFYSRRSRELRAEADEMAARYAKNTQFLVLLGFLACVALYQSVVAKRWPVWTAGALVPVAAWVVQQRHRCHLRSVELCSLIDYYGKGTARLARKWDELDRRETFTDQDHSYSMDLDLFGEGSLYQLLCSARTQIARETLARWMKAPAKREDPGTPGGDLGIAATAGPTRVRSDCWAHAGI